MPPGTRSIEAISPPKNERDVVLTLQPRVVSRYNAAAMSTDAPVDSVLRRIADGDEAAVKECLSRYGGLIWSLARRFCASSGDAEDAVQLIFTEIWKSAHRFDPSLSSEKNFVAMIARRLLISRLRSAKRQPEQVALEPAVELPGSDASDVERSAEATKAVEALKQLRPEQRRAVELSVYYGMSHGEIAEATQTPIGTVKSYIRRGLADVRKRLTEQAREGAS